MVVLMEEFHGLTLKRKGADEPEIFDAAGSDDHSGGFPLSCRATKMRRLACPENSGLEHHVAPAAAGQQDDVPMCDDELPAPANAGSEEERALLVYGGAGAARERVEQRFALRGGAEWVRAMLREADSRTVRELLAGSAAQEQGSDGLALALVPWVPPPSPLEEETEPSTGAEEADGDNEGAAAMDVEEDEAPGPERQWTGQAACGSGAAAERFVYRWPQHCMAPPQMPPVAQTSPVMWSW